MLQKISKQIAKTSETIHLDLESSAAPFAGRIQQGSAESSYDDWA